MVKYVNISPSKAIIRSAYEVSGWKRVSQPYGIHYLLDPEEPSRFGVRRRGETTQSHRSHVVRTKKQVNQKTGKQVQLEKLIASYLKTGWNWLVDEKIAIYISKSLYNEVESILKEKDGELTSVEDYVEFILRELLTKHGGEKTHTKEDEELIKKRLRRLGYL